MNKTIIKLIESYQKDVSPNWDFKCRHTPSCSNYAKEAYEKHNFLRASFLTTKRLLSCNPLFKPSYDPVPDKKEKRKSND
ncbi:membrane protein insertion efficiency factor YidD [Haploplasma axanthum]|uniref:membrane protein insertion efficiency factor YidD n=1 Tax=Haploplasma axanthum TaxID=29552 RepID=UPI00047EB0E6|nr:membrane protein insertion efficiency factor YidD [Haploplasma axanthum]